MIYVISKGNELLWADKVTTAMRKLGIFLSVICQGIKYGVERLPFCPFAHGIIEKTMSTIMLFENVLLLSAVLQCFFVEA